MLYYVPNIKMMKSEGLDALGLGYLVTKGQTPESLEVTGGPDGGAGCVFSYINATYTPHIPDSQTWIKQDGFYIGFNNSNPPGPKELLKGGPKQGDKCELADGNEWLFTPSGALPVRYCMDSDGDTVAKPFPENSAHYEACKWIFDFLSNPEEERQVSDIIENLSCVLATNYRVSTIECLALGLFTSENYVGACMSAIGLKKNEDTI